MYPQQELAQLAQRKILLRQHITARRQECAVAAERALQPLRWIDTAVTLWRQISPLAKIVLIPLGLLLGKKLAPRAGGFGALLRWAPAIFQAVRGLRFSPAGSGQPTGVRPS